MKFNECESFYILHCTLVVCSCLALNDLLVSRQIGEVAEYLPQLWELCLRVRDDIKESSRKAADLACKSLHKITVRACDGSTMSKSGMYECIRELII